MARFARLQSSRRLTDYIRIARPTIQQNTQLFFLVFPFSLYIFLSSPRLQRFGHNSIIYCGTPFVERCYLTLYHSFHAIANHGGTTVLGSLVI